MIISLNLLWAKKKLTLCFIFNQNKYITYAIRSEFLEKNEIGLQKVGDNSGQKSYFLKRTGIYFGKPSFCIFEWCGLKFAKLFCFLYLDAEFRIQGRPGRVNVIYTKSYKNSYESSAVSLLKS